MEFKAEEKFPMQVEEEEDDVCVVVQTVDNPVFMVRKVGEAVQTVDNPVLMLRIFYVYFFM
jgi:hypothetical protein